MRGARAVHIHKQKTRCGWSRPPVTPPNLFMAGRWGHTAYLRHIFVTPETALTG